MITENVVLTKMHIGLHSCRDSMTVHHYIRKRIIYWKAWISISMLWGWKCVSATLWYLLGLGWIFFIYILENCSKVWSFCGWLRSSPLSSVPEAKDGGFHWMKKWRHCSIVRISNNFEFVILLDSQHIVAHVSTLGVKIHTITIIVNESAIRVVDSSWNSHLIPKKI
jgi:hypothetical protein